eukprot:gene9957-2276_t
MNAQCWFFLLYFLLVTIANGTITNFLFHNKTNSKILTSLCLPLDQHTEFKQEITHTSIWVAPVSIIEAKSNPIRTLLSIIALIVAIMAFVNRIPWSPTDSIPLFSFEYKSQKIPKEYLPRKKIEQNINELLNRSTCRIS